MRARTFLRKTGTHLTWIALFTASAGAGAFAFMTFRGNGPTDTTSRAVMSFGGVGVLVAISFVVSARRS